MKDNIKSEDAEKLINFRKKLNFSQQDLAKKLGINYMALSATERGERPLPANVKYKLLRLFGYDFDSDKFIFPVMQGNLITIPFYRVSAAAGAGVQQTDEPILDTVYFDKNYLEKVLPENTDCRYLNCITATGDSMQTPDGNGIKDGDILFVDISKRENPNGVYIISVNGELRVKRVLKRLDGSLSIQSDNPLYPPELYKPNESDFTISVIGKVVFNLSRGEV